MDSRGQKYSRNDETTANVENGSLCKTCAQSLKLNDSRAEGHHVVSLRRDKARKSFPTKNISWYIVGDARRERRLVTLPLLPELSDGCRSCCKVKAEFYKAYGSFDSWQLPKKQASFQVQYMWSSKPDPFNYGSRLGYSLERLQLALTFLALLLYIRESSSLLRYHHQIHAEHCYTLKRCDWKKKKQLYGKEIHYGGGLDIGSKDNNDSFIKLVETKTFNLSEYTTQVRYICLSYCWGTDGKLLRTTKENIEQHKGQISIDFDMPLVFCDAISVTRKLGVRYLWIDTLCIIQDGDNGQNWAEQSTMMGDIFAHAWMTIAAAVPYSCHENLFHPRHNNSIEVGFTSSKNPNTSGYLTIILVPGGSSSSNNDIQDSRWNSRGWVWQEQHLFQRLLVFCKYMLQLRCHRREFTEDDECHRDANSLDTAFLINGLESWNLIVAEYSKRHLTNPGEKLTAISGFFKLLIKRNKDMGKLVTYLADV
ncbi:hypothetical protein BOTCAL_1012g00020 [Botryotinia calthae]|uniref:Heterokaryon incompatibility domain-containing protein n=1 Tax=Botryotinia calthae TaxID=38488 RepID=A0A4Y8CE70_9HELO|nr:hypothetical protein BOTCAL_1012g00020 [Botryotinia calthae]